MFTGLPATRCRTETSNTLTPAATLARVMAIICLTMVAPEVRARPSSCDDASVSTVERSACLAKIADQRVLAMRRSLAALETLVTKGSVDSRTAFRGRIARSQADWDAWMKEECALEGDIVMGSAGAILDPQCRIRLVTERIREIDEMRRTSGL